MGKIFVAFSEYLNITKNQKFELTLQRMAEKLVKWKVHMLLSIKYRKPVKVFGEII